MKKLIQFIFVLIFIFMFSISYAQEETFDQVIQKCVALEREINDLINTLGECSKDADCAIANLNGCWCYGIFNKSSDVGKINDKIIEYEKQCFAADCECAIPANKLMCKNKRCVEDTKIGSSCFVDRNCEATDCKVEGYVPQCIKGICICQKEIKRD